MENSGPVFPHGGASCITPLKRPGGGTRPSAMPSMARLLPWRDDLRVVRVRSACGSGVCFFHTVENSPPRPNTRHLQITGFQAVRCFSERKSNNTYWQFSEFFRQPFENRFLVVNRGPANTRQQGNSGRLLRRNVRKTFVAVRTNSPKVGTIIGAAC